MGIPEIIWICLNAVAFGLIWAVHGEPRTGTNNAWIMLGAIAINTGLLYWGGFFA